MNLPRFTAEASLYKTSGQYRTGRHTVNPSAQIVSPIWPAAREQEGEIINVHGCPPGSIAVGEQPNITCVFIPPAGTGEAGEDVPPGGRPEDGGPRSTVPKYPKKRPPRIPPDSYRCAYSRYQNVPGAKACLEANSGLKWYYDELPPYSVYCGHHGQLWCCHYNENTGEWINCTP